MEICQWPSLILTHTGIMFSHLFNSQGEGGSKVVKSKGMVEFCKILMWRRKFVRGGGENISKQYARLLVYLRDESNDGNLIAACNPFGCI